MKITKPTTESQIERVWHHFDVKDKVLGRIAVEITKKLMGKQKPYFARNMDCGDYVVVTNSKDVVLTGNKENTKVYSSYSGYPGGLRKETVRQLRARRPQEIIRHAVYGMLPKNKLRDRMIKRLYIYADENHPYQSKLKAT